MIVQRQPWGLFLTSCRGREVAPPPTCFPRLSAVLFSAPTRPQLGVKFLCGTVLQLLPRCLTCGPVRVGQAQAALY